MQHCWQAHIREQPTVCIPVDVPRDVAACPPVVGFLPGTLSLLSKGCIPVDSHFLFAGQAGPLNEAVGPPDSHHGWPLASSFPPYVAMPMLALAVGDDPVVCFPTLSALCFACLFVPAWCPPGCIHTRAVRRRCTSATSLHQAIPIAPRQTD